MKFCTVGSVGMEVAGPKACPAKCRGRSAKEGLMNRRQRNPARTRAIGWRDILMFSLLCLPMLLAGRAARADQLVWQCSIDSRSYYVICDATQPLPLPQLAAAEGFDGAIAMDGEPVDAVPASLVAVNYPQA